MAVPNFLLVKHMSMKDKEHRVMKQIIPKFNLDLCFHSSFITEIYIAPLQGYYSEALPTLAWLKRRVLRLE